MAKSREEGVEQEMISAAKICKILQTNYVPNQIFQEMLAEMKDKKGFHQVKKMIEDLISTHKTVLYNPASEKSQRASVFHEVCTIAFTIDTIFPNVLRMKLEQEFPSLINEILEELKSEKKIDGFIPYTRSQVSANASEDTTVVPSPASVNTHSQQSVPPKKNAFPAVNIIPTKALSPVKNTSVELPSKEDSVPSKNSPRIQRNERTKKNDVQEEEIPELSQWESTAYDSDIESSVSDVGSHISDGNVSIPSVSSVHTSELSSFEDAISIGSDEDNGKIKQTITIADLKERLCRSARVSAWRDANLNSRPNRSTQSTKVNGSAKTRKYTRHHNQELPSKKVEANKEAKGCCAASGCPNRTSQRHVGISFHSFPRDENRRQLWIKAIGRKNWIPTSSSKLCSLHFPEEMMDFTSLAMVRIRENAVPTIFKHSPPSFQKEEPTTGGAVEDDQSIKEDAKEKPNTRPDEDNQFIEQEPEIPVPKDSPILSTSLHSMASTSPQKILPQRNRKPNSRYASDSIVCPITQKQQQRVQDKDISSGRCGDPSLQPSQKKMKFNTLNENIGMEKEQESVDHLKNANKPLSPNVCKPYIAVHPFTSRRAAPVKLFSTPTENIKK